MEARRERDVAAVGGGATVVLGFLFSVGDARAGVGLRLGTLAGGLPIGVVGPAGASGTWTVVDFMDGDGAGWMGWGVGGAGAMRGGAGGAILMRFGPDGLAMLS